MSPELPRGAFAALRNALAAAEPYRPPGAAESFVPSGSFPSPNHELAEARPCRVSGVAPERFLAWPCGFAAWECAEDRDGFWAEEALAKACAEPQVCLPPEAVRAAQRACGAANRAEFMQTQGFRCEGRAYLDGPFYAVDWTDAALLHAAIAQLGPVKIGLDPAALAASSGGPVEPGRSGWALHGAPAGAHGGRCASLCGYGARDELAALFAARGVAVRIGSGMPPGLCYALAGWGSLGLIDRASMLNVTGEAWVRSPATVVRPGEGG